MAIMIPQKPRDFDAASQEGIMFQALESLPDQYYVFHSFKIVTMENNTIQESETDFIVFNREKGIICLEAKAGSGIRYQDGEWIYSSGTVMSHGGPFRQASGSMYRLRDVIKNSRLKVLLDRCKLLYGVWFPGISDEKLRQLSFPQDAPKTLVLTLEALNDPEPYLDRIFNSTTYYNRHDISETELTAAEADQLVRSIFCPEFGVFPTASFDAQLKKTVFHRLLREQANVLNFLEDQKIAVINGAAGTGKTMIAVEKARRNASDGEKVLFLCFNRQLRDYLEENYSHELIEYQTIASLACKLCNTAEPDYERLDQKLNSMFDLGTFPWKHVIVDEGQDFGIEAIDQSDILQTLRTIMEMSEGSFYVFFDKLQLIQTNKMPDYIENADCRLTLYRNCRNTENIATTSLRPITDRKPKLFEGAVKGIPAKIHFYSTIPSALAELDTIIDGYKAEGYKDIVILTTETEQSSLLAGRITNGLYRQKYRFSTCRKFKGLEADVIILIDISRNTFVRDNILRFYVGTSRARICLEMLANLSDEACSEVLQETLNKKTKIRHPRRELASALNSVAVNVAE